MSTQQNELNRVLEKIREIAEKSAGGDYIYRGEPDCYLKVSSTLYREYDEEIGAESLEIDVVQEEILKEARKYTREVASDLEILTELQHHGGKTNLIDFTADYLIALFFACDGFPDKDGRIILLKKQSDSYQVEKPPKTINRVESQKSIFVQNSRGFVAPDDKVIIPKDFKQPMLNYLRKHHDISTETIYNDLHGFIRIQDIHHKAYEALYRGLSAEDKGELDTAIQNYDEAIELKPDFYGAYNNRGVAHGKKHDFDTAIQNYDKAIEINPRLAEAYNNRGVAYVEKHDFDTAIQNYDKAVEINPRLAEAYNNRGNAYVKKRDFDTAIQDLTTAIEIKPDYAEAYCNRGIAYVEKRDFDKAIQDYDKAIEINPRLAEAYYGRGIVYREKRDFDTAIQDLTTAIEIKPDYAEAYHKRGLGYLLLEDFEAAIKDFDIVIELDPEFVSAYGARGLTYWIINEFEQATQDYSKVLEVNPDDPSAYQYRGFAWLHLGEWNKAKVDLTAARDKGVDIVTSFHDQPQSVAEFVGECGVQLPEDIAELLTRQKAAVGTPLSQNRYALPILTALEQKGGYAKTQDALRTVCQLMENQLEDIDMSRRLDGQEYWKSRAHAMRLALVSRGLMKDDSPHGIWEITDAGREYLRNNQGD